jgi:NAD(P)-dependent dehydrogenase (short-subunit alcohol dehydrogenase family)
MALGVKRAVRFPASLAALPPPSYRAAMTAEFQGEKSAIVTGGARRIGAAFCRALAEDGWHVLIHCRHSLDEARSLADSLGNARIVAADLTDPEAAATIMKALDGMPPARLLVNNASLFAYDRADDFDADSWDRHLDANLRAPALLSRAFAARAGGEEGGEGGALIVNMLDAKLAAPNPDFFSYTISKFGLAGLTEICARAWAGRGIRVCAIAPSVVMVSGPQSRENFDKVHGLNPLGRGVRVEELVAALRFIIATPTLTGQTILLDGGQRFLALKRDVQFLELDDG